MLLAMPFALRPCAFWAASTAFFVSARRCRRSHRDRSGGHAAAAGAASPDSRSRPPRASGSARAPCRGRGVHAPARATRPSSLARARDTPRPGTRAWVAMVRSLERVRHLDVTGDAALACAKVGRLEPDDRDVVLRALLRDELGRERRGASSSTRRSSRCSLCAARPACSKPRPLWFAPGACQATSSSRTHCDDRVVVDAVVRRRLRGGRAGEPVRDALGGVRLLRRLHRVDHEHVDRVRPARV